LQLCTRVQLFLCAYYDLLTFSEYATFWTTREDGNCVLFS